MRNIFKRKSVSHQLSVVNQKSGFTLIELLIVITITALLAAVVVVNLDKARTKARDSQRKGDITRLAAAMETYKNDNKVYVLSGSSGADFTNVSTLTALTAAGYMTVLPVDPVNSTTNFYEFRSDGSKYKIQVTSESIATADSVADAKKKAGDFYNEIGKTKLQVSSNNDALAW